MRAALVALCFAAACGDGAPAQLDAALPGAPDAGAPDAAGPPACDPYLARTPAPELFIGPSGLEARIAALVDGATSSIALMMYELDPSDVVDALVAAAGRGVAVRVLLDRNQDGNATARDQLAAAGIEVRDAATNFTYYHAKVMILDGQTAVIMSANLNGYSFSSERNYGVVDRDPQDVADAAAIFEADWAGGAVDLSCTRLVVSPVNSRQRLQGLVSGATTSLDLAVMYLSDNQVRAAVLERAGAGVAVRVLLADPGWIDSNVQTAMELTAAGVPVKYLTAWELHAKLVIADGVAFVGSENFSWTSLDRNREVGLFVVEPDPAAQAGAQFETDWAAGVVAP